MKFLSGRAADVRVARPETDRLDPKKNPTALEISYVGARSGRETRAPPREPRRK
jgi:hypothetical protein